MGRHTRKHIHKYHRITMNYQKVWACALPECYHFMPPHYSELVIGRGTLCWNCGEKTILDDGNMRRDKPLCDDCLLTLEGLGTAKEEQEKQYIEDPLGTQARETGKELKQQGKEMCPLCGVREKMSTGNWCFECLMSKKT